MYKILITLLIVICVIFVTHVELSASAYSNKLNREVTYSTDIKPIFQKYCASCHFGALSYEASVANKDKIYQKLVKSREMPPKYVAERPNRAEVELVKIWIESGAKK